MARRRIAGRRSAIEARTVEDTAEAEIGRQSSDLPLPAGSEVIRGQVRPAISNCRLIKGAINTGGLELEALVRVLKIVPMTNSSSTCERSGA